MARQKALELARQREHVDSTIRQMKQLLARMEQERATLDDALTGLIKQATGQLGSGLARSASVAQFEDLLLSPRQLRQSASHCNLEALEAGPSPSKLGY